MGDTFLTIGHTGLGNMGKRIAFSGEAGAGPAVQTCNKMILGVTLNATCEAFALADKMRLSRKAMFDAVATATKANSSMNTCCTAPGIGPRSRADAGDMPGFASEWLPRDLSLGPTFHR